jgi:hypothetical protein
MSEEMVRIESSKILFEKKMLETTEENTIVADNLSAQVQKLKQESNAEK